MWSPEKTTQTQHSSLTFLCLYSNWQGLHSGIQESTCRSRHLEQGKTTFWTRTLPMQMEVFVQASNLTEAKWLYGEGVLDKKDIWQKLS